MAWKKIVQVVARSACPKCGAAGFDIEPGYDVHDEFVMVRCGQCGHVCGNDQFMRPVMDIDKLREIGWTYWNPIGLEGPPATPGDEYDKYLIEAVRRIQANNSFREVADYLVGVERIDMGLSGGAEDQNRALITVQTIDAWLHSPKRELVKQKLSPDRKRRLSIYKRQDGCFFYLEDEFLEFDDAPSSWRDGYPPSGLFQTAEDAEREAVATINWLRNGRDSEDA